MNCNTIMLIIIISLIKYTVSSSIPNGMLLCSRYSLLKGKPVQ